MRLRSALWDRFRCIAFEREDILHHAYELELSLKRPDRNRCFQAHRQSPVLFFFKSTSKVRVLPSTGVTRFPRYV